MSMFFHFVCTCSSVYVLTTDHVCWAGMEGFSFLLFLPVLQCEHWLPVWSSPSQICKLMSYLNRILSTLVNVCGYLTRWALGDVKSMGLVFFFHLNFRPKHLLFPVTPLFWRFRFSFGLHSTFNVECRLTAAFSTCRRPGRWKRSAWDYNPSPAAANPQLSARSQ